MAITPEEYEKMTVQQQKAVDLQNKLNDKTEENNRKLEEQIRLKKEALGVDASTADLSAKINQLSGTLLGKLSSITSEGASFSTMLETAAQSGDKALVSAGNNFADLLLKINEGGMSAKDVFDELENTDFGDFTKNVEDLAQELSNLPGIEKVFEVKAELFNNLDNALGGTLSTVQSILTAAGPIAALSIIVGLIVKKFIDVAKQTLEVRRNLGVSAVDALKLSGRMEAAALQTKLLGGDSEKAKELVTGLVTEFGNVEEASALSTKNIADLTTELGIGGGETAKLLKVLSDVSGESLDTLSSTLEFEASLARAEGIPVAKVMADVAQNADAFARAGADGADEVFRAARAAADLGTNLQTVEGVMDNLVDIEGSLTKEMEAEALIGRQLNLDRARQLAQANDQQGVIDEIIAQVGGPEAFARLGRIEQGALADVFGLSVGQLAPFLGANAGGGGGAVATPQVAKDSLTAANNTNDILSKEHGKNQERHEELLGAVQDLTRATKRAYA
tara:strand:+ start:1095 stop:2615 length:1521 start_codon:yes stop_codon:yes gene_type:complete